jgi:hypothetical protein
MAQFFIPVVATYDNRDCHNTPADHAHAMATPYNAPTVDFDEVEILAASLGYKILNMGKPKKPMYRLMRDGLLIASNLYGGGLALFDVRAYLEAKRHEKSYDIHVESALEPCYSAALGHAVAVVRNISQCGYAIAVRIPEPSWFHDESELIDLDLEFERSRMARIWDRDGDRAADFVLSNRYGCGALI